MKALSKNELGELSEWFEENEQTIPEVTRGHLRRLLAVYGNLVQGAARAKATLHTLRQAMGIVPRSERGGTEVKQ